MYNTYSILHRVRMASRDDRRGSRGVCTDQSHRANGTREHRRSTTHQVCVVVDSVRSVEGSMRYRCMCSITMRRHRRVSTEQSCITEGVVLRLAGHWRRRGVSTEQSCVNLSDSAARRSRRLRRVITDHPCITEGVAHRMARGRHRRDDTDQSCVTLGGYITTRSGRGRWVNTDQSCITNARHHAARERVGRGSVGKVRFGSVFCPFFGTGNRTARFGSGFFRTGTEPRPNRSMSVRFGFRAVQTVRNRVFSEP